MTFKSNQRHADHYTGKSEPENVTHVMTGAPLPGLVRKQGGLDCRHVDLCIHFAFSLWLKCQESTLYLSAKFQRHLIAIGSGNTGGRLHRGRKLKAHPHMSRQVRLRPRQQGPRHPGHRLARTSIDHQHRDLHGTGAEPVQGLLAGLMVRGRGCEVAKRWLVAPIPRDPRNRGQGCVSPDHWGE